MAKDRDPKVIGPAEHETKHSDEQWSDIDWRNVKKRVRNLRQRIFRATKNGEWKEVRSLMKLMLRSYSNLLLSVRKVTQENKGRKTPGIDRRLALTPKARMKLVREMLELKSWRVQPAIRVYIPKANGKTRPLGIITIKNRTAQAMVKNALEPSWEARFESHSYGFRPGRATHDAIEQCFKRFNSRSRDCWVLDADIKGAFDNISHSFILQKLGNIPARELVKQWMKVGFVEADILQPSYYGVQQGGVISPVIANIAFDGMQDLLGNKHGFIRFADDFVVTGRTKEAIEAIKPVIEKWLAERGLALSAEKTRIVSINDGFNFLGFNVRRYQGKCLIKPQKEKVLTFLQELSKWLKSHPTVRADAVIDCLNPLLRGWAQYYRYAVSSQTFHYVQSSLWRILWSWCKRRHPNKRQTWIKQRYFQFHDGRTWTFFAKRRDGEVIHLININRIAIRRHCKVAGAASPDDPALADYWNERAVRKDRQLEETNSVSTAVRKMLKA